MKSSYLNKCIKMSRGMKRTCTCLMALAIVLAISGCSDKHPNNQNNLNENSIQESSVDVDSSKETNKDSNKTTEYSFFGNWEIKREILTGLVFSEEEAKDLIGRKLTFSVEKASSNVYVCKNPIYSISEIKKEDFESRYKVQSKNLEIEKELMLEVEVKMEDGHEWGYTGGYFFVNDDNTLLIPAGGMLFEVVRVK